MSSAYPPYGGAPAQPCQRCGLSLPLNEVYCRNCGHYNAPVQQSNAAPSNQSWGTTPPTSYGNAPQSPSPGPQWGQFPPPAPTVQDTVYGQPSVPQLSFEHNHRSAQSSVPQLSFEAPAQPPMANNSYAVAPPSAGQGNYQGGINQGWNYAARPATPQRSFYPVAAGMPNSTQPGGMNNQQPLAAKSPSGSTGPNVVLIVGIALLLVVLLGGSIAGYVFLSARHSSPAVTPTVRPPTPTPKGPPLFADSFNNNNNGWDLQGAPGRFSVALGNGTLALEDDDNKLLWELVPGNRTFRDFQLSVDAVLSKGDQINGYGVYIRGALNQDTELATYYRFELYGDGTYAVFKGTIDSSGKSTASQMINYTDSPAIQKEGGRNHIVINANGSAMTLIVNGETLKVITDSSYTSGSIALFVSNVQNAHAGAQATFSNLAIYPPQG